MAGYSARSNSTSLGIAPGIFDIRITGLNIYNDSTSSAWTYAQRHTGSTLSGGSAGTAVPLRDGAPAASSTIRLGRTLTFSGSTQIFYSLNLDSGSYSSVTDTSSRHSQAATASDTSPLPITISPGHVFEILIDASTDLTGSVSITVYFEEVRLDASF